MSKEVAAPAKGQVRFDNEKTITDNCIIVQSSGNGFTQVHLGFLQLNHNYRISLQIPKEYFLGYGVNALINGLEKSIPNLNCKIMSIVEVNNEYNIVLEFKAQKEKLLKEELKFVMDGNDSITLIFSARVLGPRKGTPLLKDGITCIGVEIDEMSEASDWHGFE